MAHDIAFKSQFPYSKEVAERIPHVPDPPKGIGFKYFNKYMSLSCLSSTSQATTSYTVPSNKTLFLTGILSTLYINNNLELIGGFGLNYVYSNSGNFPYLSKLFVGCGLENKSDVVFQNFSGMPLMIEPNTTITFRLTKNSNATNSVIEGTVYLFGFFLKK